MAFKKLTVIIPVFNEEATIKKLLDTVMDVRLPNGLEKEIVIVNDGSTDASAAIVQAFLADHPETPMIYLEHEKNKGKGACIQTAIPSISGEWVIIQDADLEYDPQEFTILLEPILAGRADAVYGSRFLGGNAYHLMFFWHYAGNRMLTLLSNLFSGVKLTDMETGYKLVSTATLKSIRLKENRFGFEPEITAKLSHIKNIRIHEIGISYYGRTYKEGKKIKYLDGFRAIFYILKYNLFTKYK